MSDYTKITELIQMLRLSDDYSDPLDEEIADTLEDLLNQRINDIDAITHYRNLSIDLGAQSEDMINYHDRWLCANWTRINHDKGWQREDMQAAWETADELVVKCDILQEEIRILQGRISSLAIIDRVNNELIAAQSARIENLETTTEELFHAQQNFKEKPINVNLHK